MYEKKMFAVTLTIVFIVTMFSTTAFASDVKTYTDVDYSTQITLGTPYTNTMDAINSEGIFTEFSVYMSEPYPLYAQGFSIELEAGKVYRFTVDHTSVSDPVNDSLFVLFAIFTDDEFQGNMNYFAEDAKLIKMSSSYGMPLNLTTDFLATTTGTYRVLIAADFEDEDKVIDQSILVEEIEKDVLIPDWSVRVNSDYGSPTAGPDGTIYCSAYDVAEDGRYYLTAVNSDGTVKWRYELENCSDSTPLVGPDGTIYVSSYSYYDYEEDEENPVGKFHLYAINPNGTKKWCKVYEDKSYEGESIIGQIALSENGTLIVHTQYRLMALEAQTGKAIWELKDVELPADAMNNIVVYDNTVLFIAYSIKQYKGGNSWEVYENCLAAVDLETGKYTWVLDELNNEILNPCFSSIALNSDGTIYIVGTEYSGFFGSLALSSEAESYGCTVYAINPDGTILWSSDDATLYGNGFMHPLLADGYIYASGCDADGYPMIVKLDALTGEYVDAFIFEDFVLEDIFSGFFNFDNMPLITGMAIAENGDIYVTLGDSIYKISAKGIVGVLPLGASYPTSPIITEDGKLYFCDSNVLSTRLYCINIGVGPAFGWPMLGGNASRNNMVSGAEKYTVSFESNGGTAVADIITAMGTKISTPAAPTKSGFDFAGWFIDKELTIPYDFDSLIKENITLYAKWIAKSTEPTTDPTTKPDDTNQTTKPTTDTDSTTKPSNNNTTSPKTGDNSPLLVMFALMGVSVVVMVLSRKKKTTKTVCK